MAKRTYSMDGRRADRAERIIKQSTDTAIKVAAPPVSEAAGKFNTADTELTKVTDAEGRERRERDTAAEPLGRVYDKVRSATLARLPHAQVSGRAKSFTTPDDLINGAEKIEDLLCVAGGVDEDHPLDGTGPNAPTGEKWARDLLKELQGPLSAAVKEADEASAASAALQKAQQARADARAVFHARLVPFRRVVRDVYGPQSREYHSLRDRNMPDDEDEQDAPAGAAPPTPPVATTPGEKRDK